MLKAAATGDLDAQRALADLAIETARNPEIAPMDVLREGLMFARMAASQGNDGDKGRLISMFAIASTIAGQEGDAGGEYMMAEAMAWMSLMADRGSELAAVGINEMAVEATPSGLALVKAFEKAMIAGGMG